MLKTTPSEFECSDMIATEGRGQCTCSHINVRKIKARRKQFERVLHQRECRIAQRTRFHITINTKRTSSDRNQLKLSSTIATPGIHQ